MTKWQIFALSAPAIVVAIMWIQGQAEGYFEKRSGGDDHGSTGWFSGGLLGSVRATKSKQD